MWVIGRGIQLIYEYIHNFEPIFISDHENDGIDAARSSPDQSLTSGHGLIHETFEKLTSDLGTSKLRLTF